MMGLPSDGTATTMAISTLPEGLRRFRKNRELDSTITRRGCYERVSEGFGLLSANLVGHPTPLAACRSGGARCAGSSGAHPAHGARAAADRRFSAAPPLHQRSLSAFRAILPEPRPIFCPRQKADTFANPQKHRARRAKARAYHCDIAGTLS